MSTALTVYKRKRKNERKNEMRSVVVNHENPAKKRTLLQRLINLARRGK